MELKIYEDYESLSMNTASEIIAQVRRKPDSVFCLAAGDTPRLAYTRLAELASAQKVDFGGCSFVGLDEWLGISPKNEGSCAYFLHHNLFSPLGIDSAQIRLFDSLAPDAVIECRKMDEHIRHKEGIDLMLVGVGMNGHIGFNEPGVRGDLYAHIIDLDDTTRSVGQKYFKRNTRLQQGITLGLRHFLESRSVLVVASGAKKATIMRQALEGPVTTDVPASLVRKHSNALVMLDRDAAGSIEKQAPR